VETAGGHRRYPRDGVERLRNRLFGPHGQQADILEQLEDLLEDGKGASNRDSTVVEIRCHGRAGQGLITAGELLAEAALRAGKFFQAFPEFGPERSGAPMEAFVRMSATPIHTHAPVLRPDIVMVLDRTLLDHGPVLRGTEDTSLFVVNYAGEPHALQSASQDLRRLDLATVDASGIAHERLGRPFPNIPMLGALVRATPVVSPELLAIVITQRLRERLSPALVEANHSAFWDGHRTARIGKAQVHGVGVSQ
jgi:pyruvate ferredoxin oxidoreductase gamma subunit